MGIWSWAGHLLLDTPTFYIININIESKYSQVMTLLNWEQINIESKHLIHNHKIIAKSSIWVFLFSISWVIGYSFGLTFTYNSNEKSLLS